MALFKKPDNKKQQQTNMAKNNFSGALNTAVPSDTLNREVYPDKDENLSFIRTVLGDGIGLVDEAYMLSKNKVSITLVYIDNLTDKKTLSSQIIEPLLKKDELLNFGDTDIIHMLKKSVITAPNTRVSGKMENIISGLMRGCTIVLADGKSHALIIDSRIIYNRQIQKPETEASMLGSLDSLTESIAANCNLINKRLPTPDLRFKSFTVGKLSQTEVKLLWIDGIARKDIIEEAVKRLQKIDIDALEGIGMLSALISDRPNSIFPTFKQTQRPDVIAKNLTDGQFAILCDNSPYAFIAPVTFWDQFKTMDDYAQDTVSASYLRIIRYLGYVISTTISPLYLAIVSYNHIVMPPTLAENIAKGRDSVPLPSFIEILMLTVLISIIREASLRIPGPMGYFIGTMSAIVIGQASVIAGYVSASVIIVISVSVISSYAVSSATMLYTTRLINYFLIILAGLFGMFGVINGIVLILWHMASLESFTVSYLYPVVPFDFNAIKDTFIRPPFKKLSKRFKMYTAKNTTRMNPTGDPDA